MLKWSKVRLAFQRASIKPGLTALIPSRAMIAVVELV